MVCSICKKEITNEIKVKRGYICQDCYDKMPISVKNCIHDFTPKQLAALRTIIKDASDDRETQMVISNLRISKDALRVHNWQISRYDIRNVSLGFHPVRQTGQPNICAGHLTIVIETVKPHFIIEEEFVGKEITAEHIIRGESITYLYPWIYATAAKKLQEALNNKEPDFVSVLKYFYDKKQEAEDAEKKAASSRQKARQNTGKSSNRGNEQRKQSNTQKSAKSKFDVAKDAYGLPMPYTYAQLKQKRNEFLRRWHPDLFQDEKEKIHAADQTRLILEYYKILEKYAAK